MNTDCSTSVHRPTAHLGLDLAKAKFDAALLIPGSKPQHKCFPNTAEGFVQLVTWLQHKGIADLSSLHACLEATAHYGDAVAGFLYQQGCRVSIVNPAAIRAFARCELSCTKTDKADAGRIKSDGETRTATRARPRWLLNRCIVFFLLHTKGRFRPADRNASRFLKRRPPVSGLFRRKTKSNDRLFISRAGACVSYSLLIGEDQNANHDLDSPLFDAPAPISGARWEQSQERTLAHGRAFDGP